MGMTTRATSTRRRASAARATPARIEVENVNHPGQTRLVDRTKYEAMRRAILKVLPVRVPGSTLADLSAAVPHHLPDALFPAGAGAGWWLKSVQLDLEAKGIIVRDRSSPLRLRRLA